MDQTPEPNIVDTLLHRVRAAVSASSVDERAWVLVRTAADLRRSGLPDEAIALLDEAVALQPSWAVERAALTCAIAAHCDKEDPLIGVRVGKSARRRGPDSQLFLALGRANSDAFRLTGESVYRDWARECFEEAGRLADADADGIAA